MPRTQVVTEQTYVQEQQSSKETKIFTWDDIHAHRSENDCWVVIRGKVYDVTSWVPNHPGGRLIMDGAGRDSTALFMSYHPLKTNAVLPKYYIGDVKGYSPYYKWDSEFYTSVKKQVEQYLEANKANLDPNEIYIKSIIVFSLWCAFYYLAMIKGYYIAAFLLGYFHAHHGITIAHDGNHGAFSKNKYINKLASSTMDFIGASSLIWEHQHNIGHHPNSNRKGDFYSEDYDPDAKSGYPFVRINPNMEWKPHHRFQHLYIWFLYGFVSAKWFWGDIRSLILNRYLSFELWNLPLRILIFQTITKSFFLFYAIFVPFYINGFINGLILISFFLGTSSWVFVLMFSVNHLTTESEFPNENFKERDWAKLQIMTSTNFAVGSKLWTWLSGGLNYQIEHHLFPSVNHTYLPNISHIVQQACKEYNIPYHNFPTYWDALASHIDHLYQLGNPDNKSQ